MLELTGRPTRYGAAVCLALLLLIFYRDLTQIQLVVFLCVLALLAYDLWWLAVTIVGGLWVWPEGVMDTPLVQVTLSMVLRLLATVLLVIWGLANLYNRLGPLLVVWMVKANKKRSASNGYSDDDE